MKRILLFAGTLAASVPLAFAAAAFAADQLTTVGVRSVISPTIKDAPYSGEEISTHDNTLADGTKIHNEQHTKVYRDSAGRVRRESGDTINIYDPVAGMSYTLNSKTMTGRQTQLNAYKLVSKDGPNLAYVVSDHADTVHLGLGGGAGSSAGAGVDHETGAVTIEVRGTETSTTTGSTAEAKKRAEKAMLDAQQSLDKVKAEAEARMDLLKMAGGAAGAVGPMFVTTETQSTAKREDLGQQVFEGVTAEGLRRTQTFEAGSIGNDRPINVVTERWTSKDLQTLMMSIHNDPRSGEEKFQLINVVRGEPDPSLFVLPAGYKILNEGPHK